MLPRGYSHNVKTKGLKTILMSHRTPRSPYLQSSRKKNLVRNDGQSSFFLDPVSELPAASNFLVGHLTDFDLKGNAIVTVTFIRDSLVPAEVDFLLVHVRTRNGACAQWQEIISGEPVWTFAYRTTETLASSY